MKIDIQHELRQILTLAMADAGLSASWPAEAPLEFSLASGFGDIANNSALRLASLLKKPPLEVARTLVAAMQQRIPESAAREYIKEIKAEGAGFINVYLSEGYFYELLREILVKGGDCARSDLGKGKRVLVEFVSANPTGPLSVAHARQAVVGDALANILGYLGFRADKEYYLNDEGNQINILGGSVQLRLRELNGEKIDFPENYYQGEYIVDIAREIKAKQLTVEDFPAYSGQVILDVIKQELKDFGVTFDTWFSQKELRTSGKIQETLDSLKQQKHLYEEDGALWFKSTAFGDDKDRVVIKSDGAYTYLAPDIAYHREKFKRGYEWLINLWGPDHHGYINRLKAAVMALGGNADSLSVIIVQLATIFRDGKLVEMSTRKGQYITLREVLDEVGIDASRFFFLMRKTNSHLNFDLETAKKQTPENPVYYIQYAHARICSIVRQSQTKPDAATLAVHLLKEKEELALLKKLWQFSYILKICYLTADPYMLTVYLQEAAESFHKFYDKHKVLGTDIQLTQARLGLISAARIVLAQGLKLIGVSQPEQM
ncbi:MAG TPA: arginine--tRNA ligase [Candidatus Omnitrophota bacterium]|nr:arginine--tRNA ligase [Candidatus Omnitrophota bacterium]HRZ14990.1 arginine--tRNA ligase [Candidatus Omnitrophota bacterium]